MDCVLCDMNKGVHRVNGGGAICKSCYERIPRVLRSHIGIYSIEQLKSIIDYSYWIDKKSFQPTASFGKLYIDEIHGIFAIIDKYKEGEEEKITDIFHCLSLKEVGLTATNVSVDRHGIVTCDFEFSCWFEYPNVSFKEIVKRKVKCPSKRKNKSELTYEYSGEYLMFLNIFNQMLTTAKKKHDEDGEKRFFTKYELDLFRAETLFMLDEYYDEEEVSYKKEKMDLAYTGDNESLKIINHNYQILMNEIQMRRNKQ